MTDERLGMNEDQFEDEKGASTGSFLLLKEGANIHHVVNGFKVSSSAYIPTVTKNENTGKLNRVQRAVDVLKPKTGYYDSIIGKLINNLWEINKGHNVKGSPISVSKKGIGLVFDEGETVDADNPPRLQLVSYPISVLQNEKNKTGLYFLQKAQTIPDGEGVTKLQFGPMWALKSVIEKIIDPSLPPMRGTSYTVRFLTEDKIAQTFVGKLPLSALNADYDGYDKLYNLVFTEAERAVIDEDGSEMTKNMNSVYQPLTDTQMLEFFEKNPVDLTALNPDRTPMFPYAEEVMKKLQMYDVKLLESSSEIDENPQETTEASNDAVDEILDADKEVEQAESSPVVDESTTEVVEEEEGW